ncbi:uncharacterized protein LOC106132979 [Amyelois transitella]|uniref:uncharacterized protein LOC106132979 n=1 Tax=Amyelois transitella TaxID=680683 RepID=UPI00067D2875|nr:uncharacterized protein LOC106132979 [Amyelois transitella]
MVTKFEYYRGRSSKKHVKADVIILGCSLPGIVVAHKLKSEFGDTMAIVVLDLVGPTRVNASKCNVVFLGELDEDNDEANSENGDRKDPHTHAFDNVTRHYIDMYSTMFSIPIPDYIIEPHYPEKPLNKVFQHTNGETVNCVTSYHNFDYLSFWERFELKQYQHRLDNITREVFQVNIISTESERKQLLYYDQTTMEKHICDTLLFTNSKDVMRTIVRLVCGASADTISVLFYLHQCYRTSSTKNLVDGDNTRFREKLLGYCRKRLANILQQSVADITLRTKSIKQIRTYSDEEVILETMKGDSDYICNLLAMALRPDELYNIRVEDQLLSDTQAEILKAMKRGMAKKFLIQYEENIWQAQGYSGDILSLQGPILWAMERPQMSTTGRMDRYASLVGYLKVGDNFENDSKEQVITQLVKLFGPHAETPVSYRETNISDVFIPRCGDYVSLSKLRRDESEVKSRHVDWGALDIFAEGDVAAALEAGHLAYLNLITSLRPQAQTFEDLSGMQMPTVLTYNPFSKWCSKINYISGMQFTVIATAFYVGMHLVRSYFKK